MSLAQGIVHWAPPPEALEARQHRSVRQQRPPEVKSGKWGTGTTLEGVLRILLPEVKFASWGEKSFNILGIVLEFWARTIAGCFHGIFLLICLALLL